MSRPDLLLIRGIFSDRDPWVHWLEIRVSASTVSHARCYGLMVGTACRVLEMQTIILALLENFEFSLPPQKVYRKPGIVMVPMAEGEKGVWMSLVIKPLH